LLINRNKHISSKTGSIIYSADDVAEHAGSLDVESLLEKAVFRGATDPRDKVYGILSLLGTKLTQYVTVDYNYDVETVYRNTFLAVYKFISRINLIGYGSMGDKTLELPSWVPNFGSPKSSPPVYYGLLFFDNCSGISQACIEDSNDMSLRAVGKLCGTVHTVGPFITSDMDTLKNVVEALKTEPCLKTSQASYEESIESFLQCMTEGFLQERAPRFAEASNMEELTEMLNIALSNSDVENEASQKGAATYDRLQSRCRYRRLIITSEGMIGLGPPQTKTGDKIGVLLGCDAPVILTPADVDSFQILGMAIVYDLWDNAALLGPLPKPWTLKYLSTEDVYNAYTQPHYSNSTTGENSREDPRLGPIPKEWKRISMDWTKDQPKHVDHFQHCETGEIINSDPRRFPEALRARGVELDVIRLV
jgi:hypothetical protein